ncbi:aminotransferase class I/II-fold pyridoxal phosphate-dependent enzyme [Ekhidna sp.]|jgi:LL-diaminopimelate aminotransferase|uniref:pyridoxal phosphate-dependent aminotransferase n=1 Tax=Ekhidna sp. TaxID=2608089 RepID=UPI0032EC65EF
MVDELKAKRLNGIGEYYFSRKLKQIADLNAEGHNVLNLGIGSPDLNPPKNVQEALINGLTEENANQYQSYRGIAELRDAFVKWYNKFFDVSIDSETEILPLIGSKEGIMHICMSLINEGDKVLVPNPGYPSYRSAAKIAGAEVIPYELTEENDYLPDFNELESHDNIKMMWVNYPHMPTGKDGNEQLFEQLNDYSRRKGVIVINDNPYGFILTNEQNSLLKNRLKSDLVLELNSLSKSHNMAGWRLGVLAGNRDLIQTVLTFKSNMDSGQFKPLMRAAIAALEVEGDWYDGLNKIYTERKSKVLEIADLIDCEVTMEQVGMFVWAKIPSTFDHAETFADHLLNKYRIFVPPGTVFGTAGGQHIRFSLCSDLPVWNEVIDRIKA